MSPLRPKTVSIVIPTHNRVNQLTRLLKSIEKLESAPKEVVVVNDGSSDSTCDFLEQWQTQAHEFIPIVFHKPEPQGPGAARNIGIHLVSSDAIAFTDDDCLLHPAWTQSILDSDFWKRPETAGIGGKVLHYRKGAVSEYYSYHHILEPPKYVQYLVTANACFLKKCVEEVEGFDETHLYPGGEDNGFSFKLAQRGYIFGFEKKMIVFHDYRTSLVSFLKTFFRYGKGCAEVSHKYFQRRKISKMEG